MNHTYFSYTRIIAVLAFATGLILLWPGKLFFLNDDFIHLQLSSKGKWLQHNSFRPVCDLSMWIDYKIWKLNAVGFHITNALLHIANTYLVFRFSLKLLQRHHQAAIASSNAIIIACVFFLYAFHAETIYWVIGRSASLGTLFFLLSIIYYVDRSVTGKKFILSLVFFVAGLLTYESVWIMPLVFFVLSLMDIKSGTSTHRKERKFMLAGFAVLIVHLVIRYIFIGQVVDVYEGERFLVFDVGGIFLNYVKLVLRSFSRQTGELYLTVPALLMGIVALISFLMVRRKFFSFALIVLWLISYLPYLSLGIDTFGTEGERYLYLPSIFLCIIIVLGIANAAGWYKYIAGISFLLIHALLLYDARKNYQVASAVTRSTVAELKAIQQGAHVYLLCLPEENKGALVFRNGVEAAIKLYTHPSVKAKLLTTCPGNFEFFNGVSEEDPSGVKGTKDVQVIFDYSKHSLVVSYLPPGTISP